MRATAAEPKRKKDEEHGRKKTNTRKLAGISTR